MAASSNFDMGVGPVDDMFSALEKYALQRAEYFTAVSDHNIGWARLVKAAGLSGEGGDGP